MCEQCGCAATPQAVRLADHRGTISVTPASGRSLELLTGILSENDQQAAHNRAHLDGHGILAVNLMSAPGSGKTSLLEATIDALGGRLRIAVIEGDLETENDAQRIRAKGVSAIQITTGQTCHLDAHMVHEALHALDLDAIDLLLIENVGNLVCPASFDLGQHANVTLLAVTEGDDKPAKYPTMFRGADVVVLSKIDLLGAVDDFSPDAAQQHVRALANAAPVMRISARRPDTLAPWIAWLEGRLAECRARPQRPAAAIGAEHHPAD